MNTALFGRTNGVSQYIDTVTDFSGSNGLLLADNGAGVLTVSASATVPAKQVMLDGVPVGRANAVGTVGKIPPVRLVAGGVIARFQQVIQNNNGTVIVDSGPGNARVVVGQALEAATAAGQYILVDTYVPVIAN